LAKHQLLNIIKESLPYADDPKVLEIIKPYCSTEDDESDRASNLDIEFGLELPEEYKKNNSESMLTFENLRCHTESFLLGDSSGALELSTE